MALNFYPWHSFCQNLPSINFVSNELTSIAPEASIKNINFVILTFMTAFYTFFPKLAFVFSQISNLVLIFTIFLINHKLFKKFIKNYLVA